MYEKICQKHFDLTEIRLMEFLRELFSFLKTRKKFWLMPLIIVLLILAVLIVLTSVSALAPFIYTLF